MSQRSKKVGKSIKKAPPAVELDQPMDRRRWLLLIYGAMLLALLWRLIAAWQIGHGEMASSMFSPHPATDLRTYMDLSQKVAAGEFEGPFYYQPFYYSVFLVICRWLSGGSVWMVVIVQALLGAFTVGIAGVTAARAGGRIAGVTAAYLTALCTILVFYTPFHQIATLQTFNMALIGYYAVRAYQSSKLRYCVYLGIAAAVGCLTRGNVLLIFVPLLLGMAFIRFKQNGWKKSLLSVFLTLGVFLTVESPFIIYNSIQLKRLSGPSTAADAVLALGNTPEAPAGGRDPGLPAGPMEYPQAYHIWMSDKDSVPAVNKILKYICDEPAAYCELTFRKLLLFWDYREIPNNVALAGEGATCSILNLTVPVGILLALGLCGMFLSIKKVRKGAYLALYITVIFYWGATAAFYNLARFRAPVLPLMAVFAGVLVALMIRKSRQQDWRFIRIYGVVAALLAAFIVYQSYELYRNYLEAPVMRLVRPDGTCLTLPDGRNVQFYHGPQTFGGWTPLEVKANDLLQVKFPPAASSGNGTKELKFTITGQYRGVLDLEVAGLVVRSEFTNPEFREITLTLPEDFAGDTVRIKVRKNSAGAVFWEDWQRSYQASTLNGKTLNGELVMRLTR